MSISNGSIDWTPRTAKSGRPHWVIKAAPHVMIRLKRTFEKISKSSHECALLLDTPENSRELAWFLERFPMEAPAEAIDRMQARAKEHADKEALVQGILSGTSVAPSIAMALPPRQYQEVAAQLAIATGQLLLADDLGLGKTISAIATIAGANKLPVLVVCPTNLPGQWAAQLARFVPGLRVHILKKAKPYDIGTVDVIISNYHKLGGWAETLGEKVNSVIYDEVQELRRAHGKDGLTVKYGAASYISGKVELRLGLSATPIYNYGGEIYNVMECIAPGCLGTEEEFWREWCSGSDVKAKLKDPKAFGLYLRDAGLMLRRTRAEVGRELPPLVTIPHEIETDKKVMAAINGEVSALARLILATETQERGAQFRAGGQLDMKLRRQTGLAKAPFVADFVKMLIENGEKVVLFGWHLDCYSFYRVALKEFRPAFYTGEQSVSQKAKEAKRFVDGDTPLLILSLRSGAGLDGLQGSCRTVVFGELDWSPGVHAQCVGRIHRDGQTEPTCAYFLIAKTGSDPIIADTLGVKRGQIDGLSDPDAPLTEAGHDPNHVRRLAEEFLRQRGELPPAPAEVSIAPKVATPPKQYKRTPSIQLNLFGSAS